MAGALRGTKPAPVAASSGTVGAPAPPPGCPSRGDPSASSAASTVASARQAQYCEQQTARESEQQGACQLTVAAAPGESNASDNVEAAPSGAFPAPCRADPSAPERGGEDLKSAGLTQNLRQLSIRLFALIGTFSQTSGSACEFRVNPVNFTLGLPPPPPPPPDSAPSAWPVRIDEARCYSSLTFLVTIGILHIKEIGGGRMTEGPRLSRSERSRPHCSTLF